jgi:opacity protein-like surface antigen
MRSSKLLSLLGLCLLLVACMPGPNTLVNTGVGAAPAGFWLGLWHGCFSPFSFLWSLWDKSINIYEVANNGAWYNFGFLLGAGALLRVTPRTEHVLTYRYHQINPVDLFQSRFRKQPHLPPLH